MKIVIAGGSGFIGSEVIRRLLSLKHEVILLSRNPDAVKIPFNKLLQIVKWDGQTIGEWAKFLDGANALINLSGENVSDRRWSEKQKIRLINSRINPTGALVQAISTVKAKPKVLINASAVGFYGYHGEGEISESQNRGTGFLADLCSQWEREAIEAQTLGVRVVLLRIGIVLDQSGGALKKMMLPFKLYLGGPLGSGKQWFPWIHRRDVVNIILFALEKESLSGAVNVVSPSPVTMKQFTTLLGKVLRKPSFMTVPSLILRIGLGEMSDMLLGGLQVIPKKLIEHGFVFQYTELDKALNELIRK